MEQAFRNRLERTFNISEEENEDFDEETEMEVEEWKNKNIDKLKPKDIVEYADTPEIMEKRRTDIRCYKKGEKRKSPKRGET